MNKRKQENNEDTNQPSISQYFSSKEIKEEGQEPDDNETVRITYFADKEEEENAGEGKKKQQKRTHRKDVKLAKSAADSARAHKENSTPVLIEVQKKEPAVKSEDAQTAKECPSLKSPRQERPSKQQSKQSGKNVGRKNSKSDSLSKSAMESIALQFGEGAPAPKHKPKFKKGDRILGVSHNSKGELYEARVLSFRPDLKNGQPVWQYMLHYQGWAKRWDEWVTEDGLYEDNEESRKLKQDILDRNKAQREEKNAKGRKQVKAKATSSGDVHSNIDHQSYEPKEKAYKISLPNTLQRRLLDDLDMIEDNKLLPIPKNKKSTVQSAQDLSKLEDMIQGLEIFFNNSFAKKLLYQFEFVQFSRFCSANPGKRPSEVYGGEHFLRLLVKLPSLMQDAKEMQPMLADLVKYLEKNENMYMSTEWQPVDTEYIEPGLPESGGAALGHPASKPRLLSSFKCAKLILRIAAAQSAAGRVHGSGNNPVHYFRIGCITQLGNQERYETHNKKQITKANPPQNRTRMYYSTKKGAQGKKCSTKGRDAQQEADN
eukprot:768349-Hanusia_phi.AAC.7